MDIHLIMRGIIFTLMMNFKIFIWTPKFMRKVAMASIWVSLTIFYQSCVSYLRRSGLVRKCNHLRHINLIATPPWHNCPPQKTKHKENNFKCIPRGLGISLSNSMLTFKLGGFLVHPIVHRPFHSPKYLCILQILGMVGGTVPQGKSLSNYLP